MLNKGVELGHGCVLGSGVTLALGTKIAANTRLMATPLKPENDFETSDEEEGMRKWIQKFKKTNRS